MIHSRSCERTDLWREVSEDFAAKPEGEAGSFLLIVRTPYLAAWEILGCSSIWPHFSLVNGTVHNDLQQSVLMITPNI